MSENARPPFVDQVEMVRRRFLKILIIFFSTVVGLIVGIPLISALIGSRRGPTSDGWSRLTEINSIPDGHPVRINFTIKVEDAYERSTAVYPVWVLKQGVSKVTVYSPVCPHLGCYYNWNPESEHFECPCHASVFLLNGKVISGPAPRPLDTLPVKLENGILFVKWERFKVGVPEKLPV